MLADSLTSPETRGEWARTFPDVLFSASSTKAEYRNEARDITITLYRYYGLGAVESLTTPFALSEAEKKIVTRPPTVLGGALVVPAGYFARLAEFGSLRADASPFGTGNREVELLAMEAVLAHESGLGHTPRDVSAGNLGYDIESRDPVVSEKGYAMLESMFFVNATPPVPDSSSKIMILNIIYEYHNGPERDDFRGIRAALEWLDQSPLHRSAEGDCTRIRLASLFPTTMPSIEASKEYLAAIERSIFV